MKWIAPIILSILLLTVLIFLIKRTVLCISLKKIARTANCKLKTTLSFWSPFKKTSKISIIGENKNYEVKILNIFKRCSEIHFFDFDKYALCNYWNWNEVISQKPLPQRDVPHQKLDFNNDQDNVILLTSKRKLIKATQTIDNEICEVSFGDKIGKTLFADLNCLAKCL